MGSIGMIYQCQQQNLHSNLGTAAYTAYSDGSYIDGGHVNTDPSTRDNQSRADEPSGASGGDA